MEKILVTSALPYTNGPIHIGHLAGAYLPADIYTRFKKMMGADIIYICGTDEHGAPITFQAEQKKCSPKEIVDHFHVKIKKSLEMSNIHFDHFSRTTIKEHYDLSQKFFLELLENGFIETLEEENFYCDATQQFLPDRYVNGECPFCGYEKARGDECPKCGKWLEADLLKNPTSPVCSGKISKKLTKHWYLKLDLLQPQIKEWVESHKDWKSNVSHFVNGWFEEGLKPRAITRDLTWGVPLPLKEAEGLLKVLYVWFDAPIGYISMTQEWAKKTQSDENKWKDYWQDPNTSLVHFIGKDNIPFHAIVWPGMILGQTSSYILPKHIPANEHLTIEGEKISSSIGNAIWAEDVVEAFCEDYLRFFLASHAPENKDSDFSWDTFLTTINNDLVNVIGNLHQRITSFIADKMGGKVENIDEAKFNKKDEELKAFIKETIIKVKNCYNSFKVKEAVKLIVQLGRYGNTYFQDFEPWKLIKTDPLRVDVLCYLEIQLLEALGVLLSPIIPKGSEAILEGVGFLQKDLTGFLKDYTQPLDPAGREIHKRPILFKKIEEAEIKKQKEVLKKKMDELKNENSVEVKEENTVKEITIDDFSKIQLLTAKVLEVEAVPKSSKLLKFQLDTNGEKRQILSGISMHYPDIQELVGKNIVYVANLKERNMMGEVSQGMILSATNESTGALEVVTVSDKVGDGAKIS